MASVNDYGCGWNETYGQLAKKYPKQLLQTRPHVRITERGSSIGEPKRVAKIKNKEVCEESRAKRSRPT